MKSKQAKLNVLIGAAMLGISGFATAAGFALIEQSASGMGNAYAGGAASADDASTIFFNPAGMSRLNGKQIMVAGHLIKPSAKFSDTGSTPAAFQTSNNGNGGDAGGLAFVPNAYFAMEINPQTRFGVGINAPFGLQTEYDDNWIGRFQAKKSKIEAINLNPSVSYDINPTVALGAGLNYQHITGELTSAVNYSAAAGGALGPNLEGVTTIKGSDAAWGYNFGALFTLSPETRVGLAYRSKIKYDLSGTISFSNVPGPLAANPLVANGDVKLPITMPDSFSLSTLHQLNNMWDVMADATWTGWSVLQELKIDRSNGTNVLTVQERWKNTWRFSVGTNYHYNEQWTARAGIAVDEAPVSDAYRTARIPDNDRTWISLGGQYKASQQSTFDFGYAHLFVKDSTIADMQAAQGKGNLVGTYSNSVDILSVQYAYNF